MQDSSRPRIKPIVLEYMAERAGQILYVGTMSSDLGFTVSQIQACVNNMRKEKPGELDLGASITIVHRGSAWVYKPVQPPIATPPHAKGPLLFTEVGTTRDGSRVIQCEDGTLWKATEL